MASTRQFRRPNVTVRPQDFFKATARLRDGFVGYLDFDTQN
jgi:hypothetical protein